MILNATVQDNRKPVVLLHGLYGSARSLGVIGRALAQSWRTVSLDIRNHGASAHAPDMQYATMADDVLETLDQLGITQATLIGHSVGGKIAMMAALRAPERVASLAVMDIALVAYPPDHGNSADGVIDALRTIDLHPGLTRREADTTLASRIPDPGLRGFLLQNLVPGEAPYWRIDLGAIEVAMPNLTGWQDPKPCKPYMGRTLFIHGDKSDYVSAGAATEIRTRFPHALIRTIPNAGHWLHAEQPDTVVAVLDEFLKQ